MMLGLIFAFSERVDGVVTNLAVVCHGGVLVLQFFCVPNAGTRRFPVLYMYVCCRVDIYVAQIAH